MSASWRSSPFTHVRRRTERQSRPAASRKLGPIGVKPSTPFARTCEPLSGQRKSYTPKSFAAVTAAT